MAHFLGIMTATLDQVTAVENEAGEAGGAFAVFESARESSIITNSIVEANKAGSKGGGGLYIEDSKVVVTGSQLRSNSAERGGGGATAASGDQAQLSLSDVECVAVDVGLDWASAGQGCPVDGDGKTCDSYSDTCAELQEDYGRNCDGCTCNV